MGTNLSLLSPGLWVRKCVIDPTSSCAASLLRKCNATLNFQAVEPSVSLLAMHLFCMLQHDILSLAH